jgi:hypothetical protein
MSADLVVVAIQLAALVRGSLTLPEVANRAAASTSAMCCERQFSAFYFVAAQSLTNVYIS